MALSPSTIQLITSTQLANLGSPKLTAVFRVGDNSAASGGQYEFSLNGQTGQYAWGTDANGFLKTPGGVSIDLLAPEVGGTTNPPVLTVVDQTVNPPSTNDPTYGTILYVAFQVTAVGPSNMAGNSTLTITWDDPFTVTFTDSSGSQATPVTFSNSSDPSCVPLQASATASTVKNFIALVSPPSGMLPVRVEATMNLEMVSTDANHKNPPALGATAMQAKILVFATNTA